MKKLSTTYKELHYMMLNSDKEFFVKTPNGFSQILASCEKISDTFDVEFEDGSILTCGDQHAFMNSIGMPVFTKDLVFGDEVQTLHGTLKVKSRGNKEELQKVYDISIESPHWYTNLEEQGILHHNTCFSLLMAKAYLDKYPDAVLMFYDTEFGTPQGYFDAFGIDTTRVLHVPVTDVEQLKFDCTKQLNEITREEKVIIVIDSVGNLASKKEVEDALNEKSVADMSRAKQLKSFFRIVTPYLVMKDIPMVVVNHTYKEIGLYPKDIVGGGCLVAGTKIQMEDGSMQDIEKISIGDKVRVIDGVEEVTAIWDPNTLDDGTPECFEIEFEDGYKVICSDKHKFLVDDEWVEAKDLTINMNLSVL